MKLMDERGRVGQKRYSGVFFDEFVPELVGTRGVNVYNEMANNDEVIGAILFAIEMLIRQCDFDVRPGGDTDKDRAAAQFVEECLHDMQYTWTDTLSEILSFLTYGWSYHEIVYKIRAGKKKDKGLSSKYNDGLIGWKKLPIRSQETLQEWLYEEGTDELKGMRQCPPPEFGLFDIPIEKALHFTTKSIKANPEGKSILRNAYRGWYFKKRIQEIEGIGIERDLAGFPVLTAPEGGVYDDLWDPEDEAMVRALANAQSIVTSIRRDSREGLVMPPGWKLELLSTGSRRQFDTNQIIDRYNKGIANTVLADFIFLGQQSVGSFALSSNKTQLFGMAIGTFLDVICEVFNNQGIPRLIDINGKHFEGITDYPELHHGDIEQADLTELGTFLNNAIGSGVIEPDEELEKHIRMLAGFPEKQEVAPAAEHEAAEQGNSKTLYQVTSIMEKYRAGRITENMAEKLLRDVGTDEQTIDMYIKEIDTLRQQQEAEAAEKEQQKEQQKEQEQQEDEVRAQAARKSLGRE